jgi:HD-GYP domain-containing protein (c-di-GMP phosphodiesterase class II)
MSIAWVASLTEEREVLEIVDRDGSQWDLEDGTWLPASQSYCHRMVQGRIPGVVLDTSAEPELRDLESTRELGVTAYVGVPLIDHEGRLHGAFCCASHERGLSVGERELGFMRVLARLVADELAFRDTLATVRPLERRTAATEALVAAVQARDAYTSEHSRAVVRLAGAVGRRLALDDETVADVELVALLHDVGKVAIPDAILGKPGALDDAEWATMRRHPAIGADIVAGLEPLRHFGPAIRAEHERWDGRGYPDGLAGEAIPVASRITLACDAYHAMVSDRPYRRAMAPPAAVAELRRCSGTAFWPAAVDALVAELGA